MFCIPTYKLHVVSRSPSNVANAVLQQAHVGTCMPARASISCTLKAIRLCPVPVRAVPRLQVRAGFSHYVTTQLRNPAITYSFDPLPLPAWAAHKALVHVDGISCSSKVWQLLALGSVVVREQSGFEAFYDKLLTK